MARHRVGNSYLSDQELRSHNESQWVGFLFLVGLVCSGFIANLYLLPFLPYDSPKWLRIVLLVVCSFIGGGLLAYLNKLIKILFCFAALGVIGFVIYAFLYSIV